MDNKKIPKGAGLFGAVREMGAKEAERRRNEKSAFLYDVAVVAISFFFARRHFVFGSYPLASAFIAVLPSRVLPALLGSAIGALTLGRSGVIFAINSLIIVFLRIILSGGSDSGEGEAAGLFREPYVMRVFSASVGAALSGVYNVNKGYAIFKQIDILYQNAEYTIVRTGTKYGISLYDHIALNGSDVTEGELVN